MRYLVRMEKRTSSWYEGMGNRRLSGRIARCSFRIDYDGDARVIGSFEALIAGASAQLGSRESVGINFTHRR